MVAIESASAGAQIPTLNGGASTTPQPAPMAAPTPTVPNDSEQAQLSAPASNPGTPPVHIVTPTTTSTPPTEGGFQLANRSIASGAATGATIGTAAGALGVVTAPIGAAVGTILGGIIGAFTGTQAQKNAQQLAQQAQLNNLQVQEDTQLGQIQLQNQIALWKATSYPAQVEELEQAGLNPALLYGGGGGGGATAAFSLPSGESAQAPDASSQTQAQTAQINALSSAEQAAAATNLANTTATKTAGIDTEKEKTEIASITQGISNQQAVQKLTEIQANIASIQAQVQGETIDDQVLQITKNAQIAESQANSAYAQAAIDQKSAQSRLDTIRQLYVNTLLEAGQIKAQTTNEQAQAIVNQYKASLAKAGIDPNSPWYINIMGGLAAKLGITIPNAAKAIQTGD